MALADAADDIGVCWPSLKTVARKCSISERTAQRISTELMRGGLLNTQARYKQDGSRTSNKYKLALEKPGDKLSPPSVNDVAPLRHPCHASPDDAGVLTTSVTTIKSQQLQSDTQYFVSNEEILNSDADPKLVFPKIALEEKVAIWELIQTVEVDHKKKQELLDELAGAIFKSSIKKGNVPFFRSLLKACKEDRFLASLGIAILAKRNKTINLEHVIQKQMKVVEIDQVASAIGREMLAKSRTKHALGGGIK